jgi:hypothetical protein
MPSGLASRVYQRRVPSSVKLSTGTNESPERNLPGVAAGVVRILRTRHREREGRTRRVQTTGHNNDRSRGCTRRPGRLDSGAETNRRDGSRLPKPLAERRGHGWVSASPFLASRAGRMIPTPSAEIAPGRGIHELIDGCPAPMLPPLRDHRLRDHVSGRPDWPRSRSSGDDDDSAQYPIGWIHRHRQRLPAVGTGSSAEATMPSPSIRSPECPAHARSGWNPAATSPPQRDPHRPCQTRDSRYYRDATHADWSRIATRLAPGDAPWRPRRASLAPAARHVSKLGNPNVGVDSRRSERVATLVAEQHASVPRRRPSSAGSRIVRAEARPLRSPAWLGGLDASADANRRVPDRRLDTTDHPHDVGTGDVATTTPARATR